MLEAPNVSEPEHERLGAALEERDLDGPLADSIALAHELVQAAVVEDPVAAVVDVEAVCATRGFAVQAYVERDRLWRRARENMMRIARVNAEATALSTDDRLAVVR